ncbi:hypothetical protein [Moorena producens]|uniref:hypothetical protein n=1 Tax=Moorena producens TaxID=1155739 RepID=UPI003C71E6F4
MKIIPHLYSTKILPTSLSPHLPISPLPISPLPIPDCRFPIPLLLPTLTLV